MPLLLMSLLAACVAYGFDRGELYPSLWALGIEPALFFGFLWLYAACWFVGWLACVLYWVVNEERAIERDRHAQSRAMYAKYVAALRG